MFCIEEIVHYECPKCGHNFKRKEYQDLQFSYPKYPKCGYKFGSIKIGNIEL